MGQFLVKEDGSQRVTDWCL